MKVYGVAGKFSNISFEVNPGLPTFLPALSQIASLYKEHSPKQCVVSYIPTASIVAPSGGTSVGRVCLCYNMNMSDPPYESLRVAASTTGAVLGAPYQRIDMEIDCKRSAKFRRNLYVRDDVIPAGMALSDYDVVNLQICTDDVTTTGELGDIEIEYTWEFSYAQPQKTLCNAGAHIQTTGCTGDNPFGTTLVKQLGSLPVVLGWASTLSMVNNVFLIQGAGRYKIDFCWNQAGTTAGPGRPAINSIGPNVSYVDYIEPGSSADTSEYSAFTAYDSSGAGAMSWTTFVDISDIDQYQQGLNKIEIANITVGGVTVGAFGGMSNGILDLFISPIYTTA